MYLFLSICLRLGHCVFVSVHCVHVCVIVCGCVALYVWYFVLLDVSLHVYVCTCHCVVCMSFRAGVLFFCVFLYFCIVSYLRFFVWFCLRFYVWLFTYSILCNCFCDFVHDLVFGLSCNFFVWGFLYVFFFLSSSSIFLRTSM